MRGLAAYAVVAGVAGLAWCYLAVAHGRFWRTDIRLDEAASQAGADWPLVVAVVPARDEAAVLPATLPGLLAQDYPGELRVVVVDDGSADGTAEVATRLGETATHPERLRVVSAGPRPAGWVGKVWALAEGVADAAEPAAATAAAHGAGGAEGAAGYFLFTDADIAHPADSVRRLVTAARAGDRDLVSLMALLSTATAWERLVVPAFVYFFAQLYPFARSNDPASRTAAAAGGCVLVRQEALRAAGGLVRIRGALIDDCALARLVKRSGRPGGGRSWLGLSRSVVSVRPYPRLADLWDMVARSAYTQLRQSALLLLGTVVGLLLLYAVPPVATVLGAVATARGGGAAAVGVLVAGCVGWALMTLTYVPMVRFYRQPVWWSSTLPAVALLYLGMTVDSARRHRAGAGGQWKGRTYPWPS